MAVCDHPVHDPPLRMPDDEFFEHVAVSHPDAFRRLQPVEGILPVYDETGGLAELYGVEVPA